MQPRTLFPLAALCVWWLTACGGPGKAVDPGDPSLGSEWYNAYLPYVEEVRVAQEVHAGEVWAVDIRRSAVLEPRILHGSPTTNGSVMYAGAPVAIEPWVFEIGSLPSLAEPLKEWVTVEMPPFAEGEHTFRVLSAKDRAHGGLMERIDINSYYWSTPDAAYSDHSVHVLPPRGESP